MYSMRGQDPTLEFWEELKKRVRERLATGPKTLTHLSIATGTPKTIVAKALEELEKEGVVRKEKIAENLEIYYLAEKGLIIEKTKN